MAHTLDTSARVTGAASPTTTTYTCGAGTTVLTVGIVTGGTVARAGGAPTYNGVALTQAGTSQQAAATPETITELWYLLNPGTGSALTLSIPNTGSRSLFIGIASFKAAAGLASRFDLAAGANGTSTNPTASITPTKNGAAIMAACGNGATTWAPSAITGTAAIPAGTNGTDDGAFGDSFMYFLQATAAAKAMTWTFATSEDWAVCLAAFYEVSPIAATVSGTSSVTAGLSSLSNIAATVSGTGTVTAAISSSGSASTISQDSVSQIASQTTASYSWAHTVAGTDRLLLVAVHMEIFPLPSVSGITYNGVALTYINGMQGGSSGRAELWYLVNPALGTNNIVVTLAGTVFTNTFAGAVSLSGVNQSTPIETAGGVTNAGASADTDTVEVVVTTVHPGAWVIAGFEFNNPNTDTTTIAPAVELYQHAVFTSPGGSIVKVENVQTPGATTLRYNPLANSPWSVVGASINPLSTGGVAASITSAGSVTAALLASGTLTSSISASASSIAALSGSGLLASTVSGIGSVTAALTSINAIASTITAQATITAALLGSGLLVSSIPGTSSVISALLGQGIVASSISSTGFVSALLGASGLLGVAITGTGSGAGTVLGAGALLASVPATSSVTANLQAQTGSVASIAGTSSVTATLLATGVLASSVSSVASGTFVLRGSGLLQSTIPGTSSVAAVGSSLLQALASIQGTSLTTGDVRGTAAGSANLAGISLLSSILTGSTSAQSFVSSTSLVVAELFGEGALLSSILGTSDCSLFIGIPIIGSNIREIFITRTSSISILLDITEKLDAESHLTAEIT